MCVQDVDVQCVLQFTLIHAAGCALHRHASRVIHRSEVSLSFSGAVEHRADDRGRRVRTKRYEQKRKIANTRSGRPRRETDALATPTFRLCGERSERARFFKPSPGRLCEAVRRRTADTAAAPGTPTEVRRCVSSEWRTLVTCVARSPGQKRTPRRPTDAPVREGERGRARDRGVRLRGTLSLMILPQVHLRKPCYDFYFL